LVTTVGKKLNFVFGKHVTKWLDVILAKEATNQVARADIRIGDTVLAKDVPATYLLGLEKKVAKFREVLDVIPTLAPSVKWERDETKGPDIWSAVHAEQKVRTKQVIQHKVLYEATPEHPAQIERWQEQSVIGMFSKSVWSGMLSPAEKSELLERLDVFERAVKQARQRANSTELLKKKIGKDIVNYLMKGDLPAAVS
jgi:hypothetical protein